MKITREQIIATSEFIDNNYDMLLECAEENNIKKILEEIENDPQKRMCDIFDKLMKLLKTIPQESNDEIHIEFEDIESAHCNDLVYMFKQGFLTAILLKDVVL